MLRDTKNLTGLEVVGVHIHLGSQMTSLDPLRNAGDRLVTLAQELKDDGFPLQHIDLGGGLGVPYDGKTDTVPDIRDYAAVLIDAARRTGLSLIVEPGRSMVAQSGALLGRVVDLKPAPGGRQFVILDAGMTELMRPALYGAYHRIVPVVQRETAPEIVADIVGPVCESTDTFGVERTIAQPKVDDVFAVLDAGAYGVVMSSNYNRRPMPAEVLVDEGQFRVIRRRQTVDDMLASEICDGDAPIDTRHPDTRVPAPGSVDRVRRARSERQGNAGASAARASRSGRSSRRVAHVSGRHHDDRSGDPRGPQHAIVSGRCDAVALYRESPRAAGSDRRVARGGRRGHLRSLSRVERGLRRSARTERRLADRHAALPAAAGADDPARHRAGDGAGAQGGGTR